MIKKISARCPGEVGVLSAANKFKFDAERAYLGGLSWKTMKPLQRRRGPVAGFDRVEASGTRAPILTPTPAPTPRAGCSECSRQRGLRGIA